VIEFKILVDGVATPFFVSLPSGSLDESVARQRAADLAKAVELELLKLQFSAVGLPFDEAAEHQRLFGR